MGAPLYIKKGLLGEGTFGKVYEAEDILKGERYAIKANLGDIAIDGMISLTDVNFSHYIKNHPCFVGMDWTFRLPFKDRLELRTSNNNRQSMRYDSLYFIMSISESVLSDLIDKDRFDELLPNIRRFMAEILLGLEFIHAHKFSHRDIKSNNILIFYDKENVPHAKIADYGFAHPIGKERNTIEILNHNYRAPEVAARCPHYTNTVDIWAAGIIFYEMLTMGKYPFPSRGGNDRNILERLHQTFNLSGIEYPDASNEHLKLISKLTSQETFLPNLKRDIHPRVNQLYSVDKYTDLLKNMLNIKINRYSATQCLNHPFFEEEAEYIQKIRGEHGIRPNGSLPSNRNHIIVSDSPVRKMMFKYADNIVDNAREKYPWFSYQIWFSTIDLFDRWLVWTERETDEEITDDEIFIAYHTCLYIIIKTCSTKKKYSWRSLDNQLANLRENFIQLEKLIIHDITAGQILRPTIFDEIPSFNPDEDFDYLRKLILHKLPKYNGIRWKKMANSYIAFKEKRAKNPDHQEDQPE